MNCTITKMMQASVGIALLALPATAAIGSDTTNWLENTISPVANPIYFEDPNITSEVHPLYMYHILPDTFHFQNVAVPLGGHVQVTAVQARYAFTDRLALIATKDGYIEFQPSKTLAHQYGWADIAAGLKYAVLKDDDNQYIITPGFTVTVPSGNQQVFQGRSVVEGNIFVSAEKGWDNFHVTGNLGFDIPDDFSKETAQMHYSLQLDYYCCQWFVPFVTANAYTILSNGDQKLAGQALNAEMYDLINYGGTDVAGSTQAAVGCGWRTRITKWLDFGAAYEVGAINPKGIFQSRYTADLIWRF